MSRLRRTKHRSKYWEALLNIITRVVCSPFSLAAWRRPLNTARLPSLPTLALELWRQTPLPFRLKKAAPKENPKNLEPAESFRGGDNFWGVEDFCTHTVLHALGDLGPKAVPEPDIDVETPMNWEMPW